jgi:AcrR family transcriptional regulator
MTARNVIWKRAQQAQTEIKREAVLQAAATLFNQKGYHATSLADVAARLQITKTALYYYVSNKNDLLYQCYLKALAEIDEARDSAERDGTSGMDKVCRYALSEAFTKHEPSALLHEIEAIEDTKRGAELRRRVDKAQERVTAWIREGIADGSIAECDPELAGRFVMGAFNWAPHWLENSGKTSAEISEYFVTLARKTLAP